MHSEREACVEFATSLLLNPMGVTLQETDKTYDDTCNGFLDNLSDASHLAGGVKDAWTCVSRAIEPSTTKESIEAPVASLPYHPAIASINYKEPEISSDGISCKFNYGQMSKAVKSAALACVLEKCHSISHNLIDPAQGSIVAQDRIKLEQCVKQLSNPSATQSSIDLSELLSIFYQRLSNLQQYHAKHPSEHVEEDLPPPLVKKPKIKEFGHPAADGYSLKSLLQAQIINPLLIESNVFSGEEVLGKYLDLTGIHASLRNANMHGSQPISYTDFLCQLNQGSSLFSPETKLRHRKKYLSVLSDLFSYLVGYLQRAQPLVYASLVEDVLGPAHNEFTQVWKRTGGCAGWEARAVEKDLADTLPSLTKTSASLSDEPETKTASMETGGLDLSRFNSANELLKDVSPEVLKVELSKRGMKCGGTPKQRAERLFATKTKALEDLPPRWFLQKPIAKVSGDTTAQSSAYALGRGSVSTALFLLKGGERRIDIAYIEYMISALLRTLKPTLDATLRRAERRLTQTLQEREREVEEEIVGGSEEAANKNTEDESSDEEDAPIYNPKGVPLGWDGKPIPFWLFKLHGLNHYYTCEICGNETYRGRKHFETHFAEAKHTYGMKSLGIPNTKHFHGITQMQDALDLWQSLQQQIQREVFDVAKEEEYEDSHGNVLSRAKYEDLARQGLL